MREMAAEEIRTGGHIEPELQLIVSACLGTSLAEALIAGEQGRIDWGRVRELSAYHRVDALLFDRLSKGATSGVPPAVLADLRQAHRVQVLGYLQKCAESARICGRLRDAGVEAILLKGCTVAERFYRPAPSLRSFIDIDLLVAPEKLAQADRVLREMGYDRTKPPIGLPRDVEAVHHDISMHYLYQSERTQHPIELHHRLMAEKAELGIPFDDLYEGSIEIDLGPGKVRALGDAHALAYYCHHGAGHAYERVKWLADIARVVAHMDISRIAEASAIATRYNCRRSVDLTLAVLKRIGGVSPPPGLQRSADVPAGMLKHVLARMSTPRHLGRLRIRDIADLAAQLRYSLRLTQSWRSRGQRVVRFLVQPDDLARLRLSRRWLWVYALLGWPLALWRFASRTVSPQDGASGRS